MTLSGECGWGLLRAAGIASFALLIAVLVRPILESPGRTKRRLAWSLLLLPYLTPVLLVGYAYSNFSLPLVHHPALNEALYELLVLMKLAPVAALVLHFTPSSVTREAAHCHELTADAGSISMLFRRDGRAWAIAFGVAFLFAFAEFEMASLMYIEEQTSWTVTLFDAQAGGMRLAESLRRAVLPLALQAVLLSGILFAAFRAPRTRAGERRRAPAATRRACIWAYLCAAVAVVCAVPAAVVLRGTAPGLVSVLTNPALTRNIAAGVVFALGAAGCAYTLSELSRSPVAAIALCAPGLLGALLLALLTLSAFQLPLLRSAFDTPLPLLTAGTLLLLPFAVILRLLLGVLRPGEAIHAASMLTRAASGRVRARAKGILWAMKSRGYFWTAFLLFCWAYFDLTASAILAPAGMTPVTVTLYNQMHYGRTPVLSAMVCVSFLVPVVLLAATLAARRLAAGVKNHG